MTPMSDVMVLLLTFFMMTSTFVKNEPVKVNTPQSAAKVKVPENNVLNITINPKGKVFMSMDNVNYLKTTLLDMTDKFGVNLSPALQQKFLEETQFGVPMNELEQYLSLPQSKLAETLATKGIPTDSIDGKQSQFQDWVKMARDNNGSDMKLAIKADAGTPYKTIKKMMSELQDMSENRYYLITALKTKSED